jgi:AraC family transcriptional regulator
MLRPESTRRHETNGITVEHRSQPAGPQHQWLLNANYVVMHLSKSATLDGTLDGAQPIRRAVPGDVHILPQGGTLDSRLSSACEILVIRFSNTVLGQIEDVSGPACTLRPLLGIRDLHLQNFLAALREELRHGCPAGEVYFLNLCRTLIHYLVKRYSNAVENFVYTMPDGLPLNRLRAVLDYIHGHLDGELTLSCMSTVVQMSPQHFANLFRKSTGFAPHQYVQRERLETARRLLLETNRPVADIALEVGFASQSHFTDVFHKMLGTPPSRYRRQFSQWKAPKQRAEDAL